MTQCPLKDSFTQLHLQIMGTSEKVAKKLPKFGNKTPDQGNNRFTELKYLLYQFSINISNGEF